MLLSLNHFHVPFAGLSPVCPFVLGSSKLDAESQVWPRQSWVEGKGHLPWPAGNALSNATFFVARAHCWLMVNLVCNRTSRSFSAKLLPSWWLPGGIGAWDCSSPAAGLGTSPCCLYEDPVSLFLQPAEVPLGDCMPWSSAETTQSVLYISSWIYTPFFFFLPHHCSSLRCILKWH